MILKIVEGVSSKGTFHVAKIAVNLSIFWQLPFFNNNFLKLPHKLKKPPFRVSWVESIMGAYIEMVMAMRVDSVWARGVV